MGIEPPDLCRSTVTYNAVLTINELPQRKHLHLEEKINPGSWSPSSKLAMTMSQKIYIRVFRNRHEVVNVVKVGIKDFYRNKKITSNGARLNDYWFQELALSLLS